MEVNFWNIISNAWFIGIASSIISSLIVYWITNKIFSKKQNREYLQKINAANNEILYIIRPLIVDKQVPDYEIVSSLINSTAKKYQVNLNDIYTREQLVDDIIKEVLENPFLSTSAKLEYCTSVQKLVSPDVDVIVDKEMETSLSSVRNSNSVHMMSGFMSVLAATATLSFTIMVYNKEQISDDKLIIPLVMILVTVIAALSIFLTGNERFVKLLRSFLFDDITSIDDDKNRNK